jgi:hypothetical protein
MSSLGQLDSRCEFRHGRLSRYFRLDVALRRLRTGERTRTPVSVVAYSPKPSQNLRAGVQNTLKSLICLALPRGQRQPSKDNHLAESGTPNHSTGSFGFLPRVSHQDGCENNPIDCASTLAVILSPAPRTAALPPLQAIRQKCLWCCEGSAHEVALCPAKACSSWAFRLGHKPNDELIAEQGETRLYPLEWPMTAREFHAGRHSPLKAIKRKCLDCSGASKSEVRDCALNDCALHPFRQGKNPNRTYSPEKRARRSEHLAAIMHRFDRFAAPSTVFARSILIFAFGGAAHRLRATSQSAGWRRFVG